MIFHIINPFVHSFTCLQHDIADFGSYEPGIDYDDHDDGICSSINIVDLVHFIDVILSGGVARTNGNVDEVSVTMTSNVIHLEHDGLVAFDMTLEHSSNPSFEFDAHSFASKCELISTNVSRCIILTDQAGDVLTSNHPFEIIDISVANNNGYVDLNINEVPEKFLIGHAYPNPFNPVVRFDYSISNQSRVEIQVYDVGGHHVNTLMNDVLEVGHHGIEWNADDQPSGIYFVRFNINGSMATRKVVLMK